MANSLFQRSKLLWGVGSKQSEISLPPTPSETEDPNPINTPAVTQQQPVKQEQIKAITKSVTHLSRLYMLDIVEKGKKEIELILHFVNKQCNPTLSPVIKRFRMTLDQSTHQFLIALSREIALNSHLVGKVANAYASLQLTPSQISREIKVA